MAKVILLLGKYLFWGYSKWRKIKQSSLGFEQRSVIKILVVEKWKTTKIYRRMGDVYEEEGLSQRMLTNNLNMGLLQ